jgi:hypothetical protein
LEIDGGSLYIRMPLKYDLNPYPQELNLARGVLRGVVFKIKKFFEKLKDT